MGRYSSVQAYGDNNPKVIQVPYEQAAGGGQGEKTDGGGNKPGRNKVEKVDNIMGSTAGAGSGDFHTYRAHRRNEMFRLKELNESAKQKEEQESFQSSLERKRKECEERTKKLAEKRRRKKQKKAEKKKAGGHDLQEEEESSDEDSGAKEEKKTGTVGAAVATAGPIVIKDDGSFLATMKAMLDSKEQSKEEGAERQQER